MQFEVNQTNFSTSNSTPASLPLVAVLVILHSLRNMLALLSSFFGFWFILASGLVLYILLRKPNRFLLDLNPVYFRLPLPNVNDNAYTRHKRVIVCEKLHSAQIVCPKSLAVDSASGKVFTGTLDGNVFAVEGDKSVPQLITNFAKGRPLGMRLSKDGKLLYFIEANSGLYSYHLERKELKHLLGLNESRFLDGKPSKFFDDLALEETPDGDTIIYITDVSRKFALDMWCYTFLEPDSTGRIVRYDVRTASATVLLDNLCFPNGIELTNNGKSLLICELAKRRILQHHLKGDKAGVTSVLLDNLPGEPENVRKSRNPNKETYWIGLALTRDYRNELSFLDDYSTEPNLRKLILRSCYILGSILEELGSFFSNEAWKSKGSNLKSGLALILSDFMTYPGMALEVDLEGNVLLSLQAKDDVSVISEIQELETKDPNKRILYTGSSGGPMGKIVLDN